MSEFQSPEKVATSASHMPESQGRTLSPPALDLAHKDCHTATQQSPRMERSARITGDADMTPFLLAPLTLRMGSSGISVTKLQQALIDMGYTIPGDSMGDFDQATASALIEFQIDARLPATGTLDRATMVAMDQRFDTRQDYLRAADEFDPANRLNGLRILSETERSEALKALNPKASAAGKSFDPANGPAYVKEIKEGLGSRIASLHDEVYASQKDKRKAPAKNFHKAQNLEGAANAGKKVTDEVYGDLAKGPEFKMGTNLIDQWKNEEDSLQKLSDADKKTKAKYLVEYLIESDLRDINMKYNASSSDAEVAKLLAPVIDSFIDTDTKVKLLNEIDIGWPGAQANGVQYLQIFKDPKKEANRLRLWSIFHTSIHEYLHSLAHPTFKSWVKQSNYDQGHALSEGFCDFFTLNVRAKFPPANLKSVQKEVEGDYFNANKPVPDLGKLDVGVYGAHEQAERMVGVIGIRNAQLGYFQGLTRLMGA